MKTDTPVWPKGEIRQSLRLVLLIIRTKQAVSVSRDSHFRWKKPVALKGKEAVGPGSCLTIFGVALFLLGILAIIGFLV
jgi:hypothetical protein